MKFDQNAGIHVESSGYVGKACVDTMEKVLAGVGAAVTKDDKKPEFYQSAGETQQAVQEKW
jgi:hypothetical protein